MIIFDLDGTLADCSHRRHFVELWNPKNKKYWPSLDVTPEPSFEKAWRPDWQAFYEACDQDKPINPVIDIFDSLCRTNFKNNIQIWSGRCESVKDKTLNWLDRYIDIDNIGDVKMRPIGDNTPDDQLKEKWLDEAIAAGHKIEMVFDDRKKVCDMYIRRGIFVFDVSQGNGNF